jgi:hypothetical protein
MLQHEHYISYDLQLHTIAVAVYPRRTSGATFLQKLLTTAMIAPACFINKLITNLDCRFDSVPVRCGANGSRHIIKQAGRQESMKTKIGLTSHITKGISG